MQEASTGEEGRETGEMQETPALANSDVRASSELAEIADPGVGKELVPSVVFISGSEVLATGEGHTPEKTPEREISDAAEASAEANNEEMEQGSGQGEALKGMKVRKKFGRRYYNGKVVGYDRENGWYKIVYEDGDQEDLWWWELEPILVVPGSLPRSRKRGRSGAGGRQTGNKKELRDPDEQDQNVRELAASGRPTRRSSRSILRPDSKTIVTEDEEAEGAVHRRTTQDLGSKLIGSKMRKSFEGRLYKCEVVGYDPEAEYYKVRYDDFHEEELEWKELERMMEATEQAPSPVRTEQAPSPILALAEARPSLDRCELKLDDCDLLPRKTQPHPALRLARFSFASDIENVKFHAWGEVVSYDKLKCPELQAANVLPTSSPIVHLAASHHHLAAITAAGHVWLWRTKHGNISERCNQWEHIADLDDKAIVLVDIAGPDLDRALAGYAANQEDQVPDPFYLAAISRSGEDYILQGSLPQEPVRVYSAGSEPHLVSLKALLKLNGASIHGVGRVLQVSVGCVQAVEEPPFIGYITDTGRIYIRSRTKDFMEEVKHVTGFSGKPLKIQCGRGYYHTIIMTDDGRAWTWCMCVETPPAPFSTCQAALGTLVGQKVIDVGCYGEEFAALTDDGDVHFWTHGIANPATGMYNVPTVSKHHTVPPGDKLKAITLGSGVFAGISNGRVHIWRTQAAAAALNGCFELTPLGRDETGDDTVIGGLVSKDACKVLCTPSSLIVASRRRPRGRPGAKKDGSTIDDEESDGSQ